MKKSVKILALVLVMAMVLSVMAACTGNQNPTTTAKPQGTTAPTTAAPTNSNKVTVYWWNGSNELKSEEVEIGATVSEWTPEVEGKEFVGWFAEASLTQPFDFATPITEETDIFAAFKSNEYVEDTNEYYFIGTGAGDMKASNWGHNTESLMLVKDTSVTDKNVYTIEITMFAGDMFQICYGGSWDGQQGIGHIVGAEYADGVNWYDNNTHTAAEQKYAVVKNANGEVVFEGSDEYNKAYNVWNVRLAQGQDGKYKFTFTTYPANPGYNTIEWELVEKIEPMTETHKMHIVGTMNDWNPEDDNADFAMQKSQDGSHWIGYVTVEAGAEFKVVNQISSSWHGDANGQNVVLAEAGTYCVKYTVDGNGVEVQKLEYYVVGTLLDAEGKAVNFSVKAGVSPALTIVDGIGTVDITAIDVTGTNDYSWIASQGKPGVFAFQVVYGCEFGILNWYNDAAAKDNFYLQAGEYTISFDVATGTVTVTAK